MCIIFFRACDHSLQIGTIREIALYYFELNMVGIQENRNGKLHKTELGNYNYTLKLRVQFLCIPTLNWLLFFYLK